MRSATTAMNGGLRTLPVCAAVIVTAVIVTTAASATAGPPEGMTFRAGAATSNITPPLGEPVVGGWDSPPAETIHDELHARCLVLDDGTSRLAIVLCDNVGIPREVFDLAKRHLADEASLPPERVLIASTHSHSATSARNGADKTERETELNNYQRFLARRIADGVRRAIHNLEPAQIGWGSVAAPEHVFNRRWHVRDADLRRNPFGGVDEVRMNPPPGNAALLRPAGPVDPEVVFLSVRSRDGRPIALLANYSLHYVGGVPRGEVSADYFGAFARRIAERLDAAGTDPPFVGLLSNGTSGDVNNIDFRVKAPRQPPYQKINQVADDLAAKVAAAEAEMTYRDWVPLGSAQRELTLRIRKPTPAMAEYVAEIRARPSETKPYHRHEQTYARRVAGLIDRPDELSVILQAHRIGDLGIAAIPFEVFVQTGLELKRDIPFGESFTIELANGSYGYLPTPEQHALGGYETWLGTNVVEIEASRKIAATLAELFAELQRSAAGSPAAGSPSGAD